MSISRTVALPAPLALPVKRPDLVHPHLTLGWEDGAAGQLFDAIVKLIHGANYNDPPRFVKRDYNQLRSSQFYGSSCLGIYGM